MSLNAPSLRFPLARLVQAVSAILALLLLGVSSAQAGPASMPPPPACTVGGAAPSHASIQAAVDDPACTTVRLAAGSYYEHVGITRLVKVVGAGSEIDPTPPASNGSLAGPVVRHQQPTPPTIAGTHNAATIASGSYAPSRASDCICGCARSAATPSAGPVPSEIPIRWTFCRASAGSLRIQSRTITLSSSSVAMLGVPPLWPNPW